MFNNNESQNWIKIGLILIVGVILAAALKRLFLFVLMLLLILGLIGVAYLLWKSLEKAKAVAWEKNTIEGGIRKNLQQCIKQVEKNREEISGIERDITEIQSGLNTNLEIKSETEMAGKALLAGFNDQLILRQTRLDFYGSCKKKLETILYNHDLAGTLAEKQEKLKGLVENDYEDIAKMEQLRSDLEYDKLYLDTIERLSLRMLQSDSLPDARGLKLELEELTKELRKL